MIRRLITFIKSSWILILIIIFPLLTPCSPLTGLINTPTSLPSFTPTLTPTYTLTYTPTNTPTATLTFTPTLTYTPSNTPTITSTPTITPSPTLAVPEGVVKVGQANCRYGPGTVYLYYLGLYENNHVMIDGRNSNGSWLWVKADQYDRHCWAAASVFDISGDVMSVPVTPVNLPKSSVGHTPTGVKAVRNGNQVTISWDEPTHITPGGREGALLEVFVCQNGGNVWLALQTNNLSITIQDDQNCSRASSGVLYIVDKTGYSPPANIPWP